MNYKNGKWTAANRAKTKREYDRLWRKRHPGYHKEYHRKYKQL